MWQLEAFKAFLFIGLGVFLWFFSDPWFSWNSWDKWAIGALPVVYGVFKIYQANRMVRVKREEEPDAEILDENELK